MSTADLLERTLAAIRNVLPPAKRSLTLEPNQSLETVLGLDSLALAALGLELEEAFGVEVETFSDRLLQLKTVQDVIDLAGGFADADGPRDCDRGAAA
jgi:acyl carrier protein